MLITIDKFGKDLKKQVLRLPKIMGIAATNFFKDNFKRQGYSGEKQWQPRKPNFIAPDNSKRGILIGKRGGTLRRSIRIIELTNNSVRVGSTLPYAKIHNEGGTIIQRPTFRQRMFFSYLSEKYNKEKNTSLANRLAAMSAASKLVINIPQRKFFGPSKRLDAHIKWISENELNDNL